MANRKRTKADYGPEFIERQSIPEPNSGCWLWLGSVYGNGRYGRAHSWLGKEMLAHRMAYIAYVGDIPAGNVVCHRCDNVICVNPDHLFVGTQAANIKDMVLKGRRVDNSPAIRGELNCNSKLTEQAVRAILSARAQGASCRYLAKQHGVSLSAINHVVYRRGWKHINSDLIEDQP